MDTNDLTEKSYEIFRIAEEIHHLITVHIGATCGRCQHEKEFLGAVVKFIRAVEGNPRSFIDDWNLDDELDTTSLLSGLSKLGDYVQGTIETPIRDRGLTIEEKDFG
jgi:hypothetical protein